ncbi:MAG: cytochrome ubiquinol oxidase subunit I, partial [Polyangiales bacterium]
LWPRLMALAGPVIGPAFAFEGYAFFIEAIFLGLHLYGWKRLSPRAHWLCGLVVAGSGMISGVLVVAANAWMQHPRGFGDVVDGVPRWTDPIAVFSFDPWIVLAIHSTLSCYVAVGFCVAGIHAVTLLRARPAMDRRLELSGLKIALSMGIVAALLQLASGHETAQATARNQPVKLAAMEALYESRDHAPAAILGIPDDEHERVVGAIEIPDLLSILAFNRADARVEGLREVPRADRPNVALCHFAFDVMVGAGSTLALVAIVTIARIVRDHRAKRSFDPPRWLLAMFALVAPLGFVAIEAGWIVTEAGRQPWAVQGVMRTRDAVTPVTDVAITFWAFSALYFTLAVLLAVMLRRLEPKVAT